MKRTLRWKNTILRTPAAISGEHALDTPSRLPGLTLSHHRSELSSDEESDVEVVDVVEDVGDDDSENEIEEDDSDGFSEDDDGWTDEVSGDAFVSKETTPLTQ